MKKEFFEELMNAYEKRQYQDIVKWENQSPNIAAQAANIALKPISWVVGAVIPQKAIQGALTASNWLAESITDKKDILRDGGVRIIENLQHKDLELSDKLANNVHNWANGIAVTEGGAAGFFGLPGMVIDIPALITLSLRTIHKIGLCYGFECKTNADKQFVYGIMSAAGSNTVKEKGVAVATLQMMSVTIAKETWKRISEKALENKFGVDAAIMAIKSLAKQLGINITKRKAAQAVPVIGAGVAAAMNLAFINDVAWAARRSFQQRWLIVNGKVDIRE